MPEGDKYRGDFLNVEVPFSICHRSTSQPQDQYIDKFQWLAAGFVNYSPLDFVRWLRTGRCEQAQKKQEENSFFHWPGFDILCEFCAKLYKKVLALVFICYFCGEVLNINYENHKADYL